MCVCLKDNDVEVRKNTLAMLIALIQEDYIKLRCPLFFHMLTMLNDEEQSIQDKTSSFIINSYLAKEKSALVHHFIESLFHYNSYLVSIFFTVRTMKPKWCLALNLGIKKMVVLK